MPAAYIAVLIEYRALPGQVDLAISELERLVATVVKEERDCLGIRMLRDADDPERLLLDERWSSREAYLGPHFQTAHLQEFIAGARSLFAGPPVIQFWRVQAEHSRS